MPFHEGGQLGGKIDAYLQSASSGTGTLAVGEIIAIPTTQGLVNYKRESAVWYTNRDVIAYTAGLFGDEYVGVINPRGVRKRGSRYSMIEGGMKGAFAAGKTVVDLGSGQAYAILQYAKDFPATSFIGVDSGYPTSSSLTDKEPGVQLVHDDWHTLSRFGDATVDTFLSLQAVSRWAELDKAVDAITRVARPGAVFRYDILEVDVDRQRSISGLLHSSGWVIHSAMSGDIAVKKHA